MKIKVSFFNQLKMLADLMVISLLFFVLLFFLHVTDLKLFCFLSMPYLLFFFLPVLVLHVNYLKENRDTVFIIERYIITQKKGIEVFTYSFSEIREIIIYMNGSKGIVNGTLAFSNYYYAQIKLMNESSFVITSLCSSKIDEILKENFKDIPITTEKVFYPSIKKST